MPAGKYGQFITFAIERDEDLTFRKWIWIRVRVGDTVQKIVSGRGHPEDARAVAKQNKIRSTRSVLRHKPRRRSDRKRLKVPGRLRADLSFDVYPTDEPPKVTDGYATFSTVDRPERVGLTKFDGFSPMQLTIPIVFEAWASQSSARVERGIHLLERMAGRGVFPGAAIGPPPIIRLSTTNSNGVIVPLLPRNVQWSAQNPSAPLWRVTGLEWADGALRNRKGERVRQGATVTVQQHTRVALQERSAARRAKGKKRPKSKRKR